MPQSAPHSGVDPRDPFLTLPKATRRYQLHDSMMTNEKIAEHLGLIVPVTPGMECLFYSQNDHLVAIRTERDVVVIFHFWQMHQLRMEEIGTRIR